MPARPPLSRPAWLCLILLYVLSSGGADALAAARRAAPLKPGSYAIFVPGRARCADRGFMAVQKCGTSGLVSLDPQDKGDASRHWQLVLAPGPGGLHRFRSVLRSRTPKCPSLLTASSSCGASRVAMGFSAIGTGWKVECKRTGNRGCTAYVPARNGCPRRYLGFSLSCGNPVAGLYRRNEAGTVTTFDAVRPQNASLPRRAPPPSFIVVAPPTPQSGNPPVAGPPTRAMCPNGFMDMRNDGVCLACAQKNCATFVPGTCSCSACQTGYIAGDGGLFACVVNPLFCKTGFGLDRGECVACRKEQCTAYDPTSICYCATCQPGFSVLVGGNCANCRTPGCLAFKPFSCDCAKCSTTGYFVQPFGKCVACYVRHCTRFVTGGGCKCRTCKAGFELDRTGRYCLEIESCFPGDAMVHVEGSGPVRMDRLQVGNKVLTMMGAGGQQAYEEVVFFGHRDAHTSSLVTLLTVRGSGGNATRTLRLTGRHYMPTLTATGGLLHKYAADVAVGDRLLMVDNAGESVVGHVVGTNADLATGLGLFNPYTKGGFIVVDGVLASAHSDFILDAWTPPRLRHLLPHIYQAAFKPLTWLYALLGPLRMAQLTDAAVPLVNAHFAALQLLLASCGLALGAGVWRASRLPAAAAAGGGKTQAA